jgi:hypothetical protein
MSDYDCESAPGKMRFMVSAPSEKRLEALGAKRWDHQQERGFDFWVMRDTWNNELILRPSSGVY